MVSCQKIAHKVLKLRLVEVFVRIVAIDAMIGREVEAMVARQGTAMELGTEAR